ncbi:MAG: hypothetical protein KF773_23865 [Deltaproteobacteria bacterium]|nr:hypothetical protein [Deltaproteobacteria bacterium]
MERDVVGIAVRSLRCFAVRSGWSTKGIAGKRPLLVTDGVERVFEVGARGAPEVTAA